MLCYLAAAWIDRRYAPQRGGICNRAKNTVLVFFSLLFYAWGEPVYVFLMIASVFINYLMGLGIDGSTGQRRKMCLVGGIAVNLLILGTFKYLGFFAMQLCGMGIEVDAPTIALPIGISFYTFQAITYLVDVYRNEARIQRNFLDLLLYISMFPQLIAGPIVRYQTVATDIYARRVTIDDFAAGSYRFFIGLGKKVILANQLSEISDLFLVDGLTTLSASGAWLGIIAFTLQIYFDFSGYSDMAIGIGRCLGFHFPENFNHPYCCNSITDFWRRWHMSLGGFFRDYVYIPMGGNRRHQIVNILTVWFLTGMWHGASWNFILWGLYFGVIIMIEKYTLLRIQHRIPRVFLHLYGIVIVVMGWGIFYFVDFNEMQMFFNAAFGGNGEAAGVYVTESALMGNFWLFVLAIVFSMPVRSAMSAVLDRYLDRKSMANISIRTSVHIVVSIASLVLCTALLVGATNNAFIYTRF